MARINWFDANRSLSTEVVDFMRCIVWKSEISEKFAQEQAEIEQGISALEKLRGSIMEERIPEMKQVFLARSAELEKERKEQIEKEATYALSDSDKELRKSLAKYAKDGSADPVQAIIKWFGAHGLTIDENCAILDEIFNAAGEKVTVKQIVRTNGRTATSFNNSNCFKMVFAKCYEHMVNAGTIKATQIPPLMASKYAPKQKKNKKESKKA